MEGHYGGAPVGSLLTENEVVGLCRKSKGLEKEDINDIIEELFAEKNVPPTDHPFYIEFIRVYESLENESLFREEDRIIEKAMANDQYVLKKQEKCQEILSDIKCQLDDPKLYHLLKYQVNRNFSSKYLRSKYKQHPLKMSVYWMDVFLRPVFRTPSKYNSKKARKKIVSDIIRLHKEKKSPIDLARLREDYRSVLKYTYKRPDGRRDIYW